MFGKILVATDASDYSRRALTVAVDIAKKYSSEIELLHVIRPMPYTMYALESVIYPLTPEQINDIKKEVMEATLQGVETAGIPITHKTVIGFPANEVINESEKGFHLIIMGTRGHGALGGAIIGSVTQKVLAESKCPVLIVK